MIITGDNMQGIQDLKHFLGRQFEMKDLGPLNYFLGLEVSSSADGYYLTQAKYTSDLISRASITDSKIVNTPIEYNCRLNSHDGKSPSDTTLYRQLVGSLIYLIVTRPDISYAVHVVSQFMAAPRSPHYAAVLRILRYLKGTIFDGLHFSSYSSLTLQAYSDTDRVGDPTARRSTTGYCFLLGYSLISWRSKKQTVVTRSSTEAEYRALTATTTELIWSVGYYRILVLTVPLQLNFIVIIEVLFKLLIMMSFMNVINILRLIVTSFIIICFRVHSHFSLFHLRIN